ncbi:MAG: 3-isopropylmalate dehydratase small subunit 1 [Alphaproteobacteria bacterium MarineAlpha9_Bin3]|nr:MAG: 3-isopropylmalate dehydratase small subunit 1 [Alphaproteobacteria bacterium MarineAlpha9_Bin3]|tara:strand:- start:2269 stop:2877 length:609 start_codon:yes stop_codon:yes gene_type:complete
MKSFNKLSGVVAPLPQVNIDTDAIIPKQFLKTIERTGLGKHLFHEKRYDKENNLNSNFILNKAPWDGAKIIVAGDNFGCGSSREHAPWALLDFGISCIISTSFADIFYNNCFKNGILPIVLEEKNIHEINELALEGIEISINLEDQQIIAQNKIYKFEIDPYRKHCLLNGLDDIGITLETEDKINLYEDKLNNKKWHVPDKI